MSIETHSIYNVMTPSDLSITNVFTKSLQGSSQKSEDSSENNFGNYFKSCVESNTQPQAYWGSNKPAPDVCTPNLKSHSGIPCNSIWNNQTKRKGVVFYDR